METRSLAGIVVLAALGLACSETSPVDGIIEGNWGGEGIQVEVRSDRTLFYLACADGVVDGSIVVDAGGRFSSMGTIAIGPVVSESVAARYAGRVDGHALTVTITVAESGFSLGTFMAERDRIVQLVQCR